MKYTILAVLLLSLVGCSTTVSPSVIRAHDLEGKALDASSSNFAVFSSAYVRDYESIGLIAIESAYKATVAEIRLEKRPDMNARLLQADRVYKANLNGLLTRLETIRASSVLATETFTTAISLHAEISKVLVAYVDGEDVKGTALDDVVDGLSSNIHEVVGQ